MSYEAVLDNEKQTGGQVATINGWNQFRQAVESLTGDLAQLRHLVEYGWCQDLIVLESDLTEATEEGLDADNADIAAGLLAMLKDKADAETICVGDDDGEEGQDDA